uniref:Uncharacterized protein n=1 Tax=Anopheles maculatus TaxID=74869 RepID=A0A182SH68_9DIPT
MLRDVIEEAPKKEKKETAIPVIAVETIVQQNPERSSVEQESVTVVAKEQPTIVEPAVTNDSLVLGGLIQQLTPAGSFEALSKRCQEQLSELEAEDEQRDERVRSSIERDYDNLVESIKPFESDTDKKSTEEEIDLIMKECGIELESNGTQKVPASSQTELSDRASEPKSSSETDPFPKSSSQSAGGPKSIASETQRGQRDSSSSPSSAGRTKPSRSPPVSSVRLTPSDTESQYNSSEELAMIFGIKSPTPTGKEASDAARVSLLSLSCAKPSSQAASNHPTDETDEHDGGDGVILSVPVPTVPFHNHSPTTSTVASVCVVSATNSIACKNVTTNTSTNTSTDTNITLPSDTQPHDTTVETVPSLEEEASIASFYLRSSFSNHLHHSLDTIHEDLAEELEETTAHDVDSTTTDSGNVSLNDFGSEFAGNGAIERKVTFVNEVQIGPCGNGYYPFRSVLQIPEIFIEDVSGQESSVEQEQEQNEELEQPAVSESIVDDPPVETFGELQRLEEERRRLEALVPRASEDVDGDRPIRYRGYGESSRSSSSNSNDRNSSVGGGVTKRKSSSSSLVQPQHVVLASGEEMSQVHPSTTESSSIVTLPGKPSTIPLISCLGETSRTSAANVVAPVDDEDVRDTQPMQSVVAVRASRNHNRDSGGAFQNLCFCLI